MALVVLLMVVCVFLCVHISFFFLFIRSPDEYKKMMLICPHSLPGRDYYPAVHWLITIDFEFYDLLKCLVIFLFFLKSGIMLSVM